MKKIGYIALLASLLSSQASAGLIGTFTAEQYYTDDEQVVFRLYEENPAKSVCGGGRELIMAFAKGGKDTETFGGCWKVSDKDPKQVELQTGTGSKEMTYIAAVSRIKLEPGIDSLVPPKPIAQTCITGQQ